MFFFSLLRLQRCSFAAEMQCLLRVRCFEGRCVLVNASKTRAFHCLFACELAVLTRSLAGRLANAICCYLALLYALVQHDRDRGTKLEPL